MKAEKIKILIIDNSKEDMILVKNMLDYQQKLNFELKHTESLNKSFDLLARENIDIVLLDLTLPDANGLETLIKFREKVPDIPVIVLTGHNDDDIALEALKLGAQDYLIKGMFNFDL